MTRGRRKAGLNYYFFLQAPGLDCEIGLANFAPAEKPERARREYYICHARPAGSTWQFATFGTLAPQAVCAVRPTNLGLDAEQAASTLVFLSPEELSGERAQVPRYSGFDSIPAWRANLKVVAPTTSASYQGEYPAEMLDIARGKLLSVSAMLQGGPGIVNGVFLVSFRAAAESFAAALDITRLSDGALLKRATVHSNRVNYVDLSDLALGAPPELIALSSTGIAGIPVYLARDSTSSCLSLEHTHPPTELTAFGSAEDRFAVVARMREQWLQRLRHA